MVSESNFQFGHKVFQLSPWDDLWGSHWEDFLLGLWKESSTWSMRGIKGDHWKESSTWSMRGIFISGSESNLQFGHWVEFSS